MKLSAFKTTHSAPSVYSLATTIHDTNFSVKSLLFSMTVPLTFPSLWLYKRDAIAQLAIPRVSMLISIQT